MRKWCSEPRVVRILFANFTYVHIILYLFRYLYDFELKKKIENFNNNNKNQLKNITTDMTEHNRSMYIDDVYRVAVDCE